MQHAGDALPAAAHEPSQQLFGWIWLALWPWLGSLSPLKDLPSASPGRASLRTFLVLIHMTLASASGFANDCITACCHLLSFFGQLACDSDQCSADAFQPWIEFCLPCGLRASSLSSLLASVDLPDMRTNFTLALTPVTVNAHANACLRRKAPRDPLPVPCSGTLLSLSSPASADTAANEMLIYMTLASALRPAKTSIIACCQLLFLCGLLACDNVLCSADASQPWTWLLSPLGLRVTSNSSSVPAVIILSTSPLPASVNFDMSDELTDMTLACQLLSYLGLLACDSVQRSADASQLWIQLSLCLTA